MVARLRIRDASGTLRTIVRVRIRDATNTLRTLQRIRIRDATGILRTVFQYLSAATVPLTEVTGSYNGTSGVAQNITTANVTIAVTGGVAPFTYLWSQVGVAPYTFTIGSATAATTTFTGVAIPAGADSAAVFKCAVTDAGGNVVDTNNVQASVFNNSTA